MTSASLTASSLRALSEESRRDFFASLSDEESAALLYDWDMWARPEQLTPECLVTPTEKVTWLLLAGRGFGKTRVGSETLIREVQAGRCGRIALIAETAADARDVMVEGDSGIMRCSPPWFRPVYEPSKRRLTWPNGALAFTYNAVEPDQLRGPQFDFAWGDELAKWRYAQETFDNLQFGLRLGQRPRQIFTTTPRPIKLVREMVNDPSVYVTRGRTLDNAPNLAASFMVQVRRKYEGTRLGRQELEAEILMDTPGALWSRELIERCYLPPYPDGPFPKHLFSRIVVGVDPAVSNNEGSDETGIIVAGVRASDSHVVVLNDATARYSPSEWALKAVSLYRAYSADKIVAEVNQGGDMVESTVRMVDPNVSYKAVHASKGKYTRAEPVSMLYEQGRVHHLGSFPALEDQMSQFTRDFDKDMMGFSPDRVDAMVWALTELKIDVGDGTSIIEFYRKETEGKHRATA
jgi:phage terminase large subunit-like protein